MANLKVLVDVKKIVVLVIFLTPVLLSAIGWVVYVGGYGSFNTNNNLPPSDPSPAEEHLAAPYFFSAIVAPVLLILIAVESILIVMLRSQWIVHSIMLSIIFLLAFPLIAFNGWIMQFQALLYTGNSAASDLFSTFNISIPPIGDIANAIFAGLLIETFFLCICLLMMVLAFIIPARSIVEKLPQKLQEPFLKK